MNATITAEIANQRHLEFVAQADARRAVMLARAARRSPRPSGRQERTIRLRRRPVAMVLKWIAAGEL